MIERFSNDAGKSNLLEALRQQRIVAGNQAVTERLAAVGQLVPFEPGETIIKQNAEDTDVYFLIAGEAGVFVNHREVGVRGHGEVIGEMVAVNPSARRSATVKAKVPTVALKVSAAEFVNAGEGAPEFWKYVARMTGDRLRAREKFHRPSNETPILFIGSSVEGIPLAKELKKCLKHDDVIPRPWYQDGVFGPSRYTISDLMLQVAEADFAVFIFGPDDQIHSRGKDHFTPRDNVIFEMGLFMGKLGRERVFMVMEHKADLKIPSDLTGVNPITYVCKKGCTLTDYAGDVCADLEKVVKQLGAL
jgi:predicted nucleotide-binding protein